MPIIYVLGIDFDFVNLLKIQIMKEQDNQQEKKGERFEDFQKEQNNNEIFPEQKNRDGLDTVSNTRISNFDEMDLNETVIHNTTSGVRQTEEDYDGISEDDTYDGQNSDSIHGFKDAAENLESDSLQTERDLRNGSSQENK